MEPQKVTLFGNSFFADVIKDLQIILDLGDPKSNNLHTHTHIHTHKERIQVYRSHGKRAIL
jgi:hypothetical protein